MTVHAAEAILDACQFQPDQLPRAMETAAQMLGYEYFCLVAADLNQRLFIASERQQEGIAAYFTGNWAEVDYRVHAENSLPAGTLYLDHRVVPDERRRKSEIYNAFYRPRDMANYAGIRFDVDGKEWFCSASRGEGRGEIDGAEAEAFQRVAQTSIRVASMAARLGEARAKGMLDALEASRIAAIVLDQDGRVGPVTTAARSLFGNSLNVREGRLVVASDADVAALDGIVQLARSRMPYAPPRSFLLRGRDHAGPILVNVSRIVGAGLDELAGARILLVLSDMGARNRVLASELVRLFSLTPAEADVVVQFTEGLGLRQIADRRHVVVETIREQMKSVYRKTGVSRQVDLLRLLGRLQD